MYQGVPEKQLIEIGNKFLAHPDRVGPDDLPALRRILHYHEWRYYVKNDPVISDYDYDRLYKILQRIESEHPELITPDSPTQRIGSDLSADFKTARHLTPFLSLENSYHPDDLNDFDRQVRKLTGEAGPIEYIVEPKFDGSSLGLLYENNILVRGTTRGNGIEGDDITNNVKTITSLPLRAHFSAKGITKAELRGEGIIRKDNFAQLNRDREQQGLDLFANARNAAAGALRMKDPKETAARKLDCIVYQLTFAEGQNGTGVRRYFDTHGEVLHFLSDIGFLVPHDFIKTCIGIREVIAYCADAEARREAYPYEIDGLVIKVNRLDLQEKCGATAHHPRWAIAFKFKAKQAVTTLEDVQFQVGKLGAITPVGKVTPVELAGVTISSVSLHNEDFIRSKDIRIGDRVIIERAGEVIPYIVKSLPDLRDDHVRPIRFPSECPVCHTPLVKKEGEAVWRCPNYDCPEQVVQRLIHFVSKDAMDIDGMGESQVRKFYQLQWLHDFDDIYKLPYDKIRALDGFGDKSVENLRRAIEASKTNPIYRLLFGLSIPHVGLKAAKTIAAHVGHLRELQQWTIEQFTAIKDVGPIMAQSIHDFFHRPRTDRLLASFEALGVNLKQTDDDRPVVISSGPLAGRTILFTGTLQHMTRTEAQKLAEKAGAQNLSGVSKHLNILVVGEKAGSKLRKARELGTVQIIDEQEFLKLVEAGAGDKPERLR